MKLEINHGKRNKGKKRLHGVWTACYKKRGGQQRNQRKLKNTLKQMTKKKKKTNDKSVCTIRPERTEPGFPSLWN